MANERAISIHFREFSDRSKVIVDHRTGTEYPRDEVETGVLVYEDRVTGWFFSFGEKLKAEHNAGFVVLQIAVAQIEGMEQYRCGESSEGDSKKFFREGLKRIFSLDHSADWLDRFYETVRCGLFHDGMTRKPVDISPDFAEALEYADGRIRVNPNKFFEKVLSDFKKYVTDLQDPRNTDLRERFYRMWSGAA